MTDQYDVAVIGAGTTGIPVALSAAERGAKVVLVEAADAIGGTLHLSSGSLSATDQSSLWRIFASRNRQR